MRCRLDADSLTFWADAAVAAYRVPVDSQWRGFLALRVELAWQLQRDPSSVLVVFFSVGPGGLLYSCTLYRVIGVCGSVENGRLLACTLRRSLLTCRSLAASVSTAIEQLRPFCNVAASGWFDQCISVSQHFHRQPPAPAP